MSVHLFRGGAAASGNPEPDHPGPAAPAAPFPEEPGDMPVAPEDDPRQPGPQPPPLPDPEPEALPAAAFRDDVRELGEMARRGIRFQFAFMELLKLHGRTLQALTRALSYLEAGDLDEDRDAKAMVTESILGVERELTAQQPETTAH